MAESSLGAVTGRFDVATISEEFDCFRDIPDEIILVILSFLPLRDAVRTCVLSTRWKHMWKVLPNINLTCADAASIATDDSDPEYELFKIIIDILDQRCYELETFAGLLSGCHPWLHQDFVSHTISLHSKDNNILYIKGFSCDTLTISCFNMWKKLVRAMIHHGEVLVMKYALFTTPSTSDHVKFLNHLAIDDMDLTKFHLSTLLGRCSILRSLSIFECKGVIELRIYHSRLKFVSIGYCSSLRAIEISCSNLQKFNYVGEVIPINFTDVPCLEKLRYALMGRSIPVDSVFNSLLRSFNKHPTIISRIEVRFFENIETVLPCPFSSHFATLCCLDVWFPKTHKDLLWLVHLLEAAPCLEELKVTQNEDFSQMIANEAPETVSKPLLVTQPHDKLQKLKLTGFIGRTTEIEFILCILECATSLRVMWITSAYFVDSIDQNEIEKANAADPSIARARERAHQYLQHKIPSNIIFTFY